MLRSAVWMLNNYAGTWWSVFKSLTQPWPLRFGPVMCYDAVSSWRPKLHIIYRPQETRWSMFRFIFIEVIHSMPGVLFMYLYQNREISLFIMVTNIHTAWPVFCYLFLWYHTVIVGASDSCLATSLEMESKMNTGQKDVLNV